MAKYQRQRDSSKSKYFNNMSKYMDEGKIGEGTIGEVFKAKHKKLRNICAAKKVCVLTKNEEFPITALEEIRILRRLRHENIVSLRETCRAEASARDWYKGSIYVLFEFCAHSLAGPLSNLKVMFSLGEIKSVVKQLLNGLYYIHSKRVVHRDMKTANILITEAGILKLADCGLAWACSFIPTGDQQNRHANRVVTSLWYRPPELLLGARNYGPAIDLWGAGCIMAEMWTRTPIMQGDTEQHQLTFISHLCGSITPIVLRGLENLELSHNLELPQGRVRKVKDRLRMYVKEEQALDVMDKLLTLDPRARIDADQALNHDFFWTDPMPCSLERMLSAHTQCMSEYVTPRRRIQQHPSHAGRANHRNLPHVHRSNRP